MTNVPNNENNSLTLICLQRKPPISHFYHHHNITHSNYYCYLMFYMTSQCLAYCYVTLKCHIQENVSVRADNWRVLNKYTTWSRSVSFVVSVFVYALSSFTYNTENNIDFSPFFQSLQFCQTFVLSNVQIDTLSGIRIRLW